MYFLWNHRAQKKPHNKDQKDRVPGNQHHMQPLQQGHHFERVCRAKKNAKSTQDAISNTMRHHVRRQCKDCQIPMCSTSPQEIGYGKNPNLNHNYVRLQMRIELKDYRQLGFKLSTPPKRSIVSAMADAGCQSSLAGPPSG